MALGGVNTLVIERFYRYFLAPANASNDSATKSSVRNRCPTFDLLEIGGHIV
jgi:hypothetical protein